MKNIFVAIIITVTLMNCQKTQLQSGNSTDPTDTIQIPVDTPIIGLGKGAVLKNDIAWSAPFNAWYHSDKFKIFKIRAKVTYSSLRSESFFIQDIPCSPGIYPVQYFPLLENLNNGKPESAFIMMQDYDQPIGDFLIDTTRNDHFIEVIKYDSIARTVEGRFQVFLKKEPSNTQWPGIPDSIFLTEGKFHLKIQEP